MKSTRSTNLRFSWSVIRIVRQHSAAIESAPPGPPKRRARSPYVADRRRVDVAVLVDLQRVEEAVVHQPELRVVAGRVHRAPRQRAIARRAS